MFEKSSLNKKNNHESLKSEKTILNYGLREGEPHCGTPQAGKWC